VDVDELPVAAGVLALGTGHMVIGAAANSDIVLGKGGRPAWWTPEALNLSGVHVGLPQTLLGDRKIGHKGYGERVAVGINRTHHHDGAPLVVGPCRRRHIKSQLPWTRC